MAIQRETKASRHGGPINSVVLQVYPQDGKGWFPLTKKFVAEFDAHRAALVFIFGSIQKRTRRAKRLMK